MSTTSDSDARYLSPGIVEAVTARPVTVAVAAVIGLVVALAVSVFAFSDTYTATATATMSDPQLAAFRPGAATPVDFERHLSGAATFASSQRVAAAAAADLGIDAADLSDRLSVRADVGDRTLRFRVSAPSAPRAAEAADAAVAAFDREYAAHLAQQAEETLAVLDEQIAAAREDTAAEAESTGVRADLVLSSLEERRVELAVNTASYGSGVEFVEPAKVPGSADAPDRTLVAVVGLLLGAVVGAAYVWFRADRRRELASSDAPGAVLDAPLLGKIPEFAADAGPLTRAIDMPADEYQFVASALHSRLDEDKRVILVAGADSGAGATVTAANLAVAAARDDLTVAVVDACLGEELGALFEQAPNQAGLLDLLSSGDGAVDAQRLTWALGPVSVGARSVRLLALGTSSRATLASQLRSRAAEQLFDMLRSRFDRIIVDCGSVLDVATAGSLARSADATVLVVRNGTESDTVVAAGERLAVDGLTLAGYVYTRADGDERRRFRTPASRPANMMPVATAAGSSEPGALPAGSSAPRGSAPVLKMNGTNPWSFRLHGDAATPGPYRQGSAN